MQTFIRQYNFGALLKKSMPLRDESINAGRNAGKKTGKKRQVKRQVQSQ